MQSIPLKMMARKNSIPTTPTKLSACYGVIYFCFVVGQSKNISW